jgi:hypothetical protein
MIILRIRIEMNAEPGPNQIVREHSLDSTGTRDGLKGVFLYNFNLNSDIYFLFSTQTLFMWRGMFKQAMFLLQKRAEMQQPVS